MSLREDQLSRIEEAKKDQLIKQLIDHGIFKKDGQQLYDVPLQILEQEWRSIGKHIARS